MNTLTNLKYACVIALLSASLSVYSLDFSNPFGKKKDEKKEESKEESQKETLATLEPKLAEQEAKISSMKEEYARKDPEAGNLMTKMRKYGSKLNEMNAEYGNVAGKLDTYLSGKYPKYKKASGSYNALKKKYDSMKSSTKAGNAPKKETQSGFGALGDAAKSTMKDASSDAVAEMGEKLEKQEAKLTEMQKELGRETTEGKKLLLESEAMKAKMASVESEQKSTDMELTALLKKRYPDFKAVTDDYDVLKKTYDDLKTAKENKAEK